MTNKRPVHEGYFFEVTFVTDRVPNVGVTGRFERIAAIA